MSFVTASRLSTESAATPKSPVASTVDSTSAMHAPTRGVDVADFKRQFFTQAQSQAVSAAELGLGLAEESIDVIVGGPPCQAFARVGRPKREIDEHPQAFRHDPRARLYQEYLRYVTAFHPLAVLVENVPDVLNHGGQNIAEEICEILQEVVPFV